jgi:hypothetical protein
MDLLSEQFSKRVEREKVHLLPCISSRDSKNEYYSSHR